MSNSKLFLSAAILSVLLGAGSAVAADLPAPVDRPDVRKSPRKRRGRGAFCAAARRWPEKIMVQGGIFDGGHPEPNWF